MLFGVPGLGDQVNRTVFEDWDLANTGSGTDLEGLDYNSGLMERIEKDIDETLSSSPDVSNPSIFGDLSDMSVEQKLNWLAEHDPSNKTGWIEMLLGIQANRENTQVAFDRDVYLKKYQLDWTAQALERNGINPILAYQYLSGNGGSSVGAADVPSSSIYTNQTSRRNNAATVSASQRKNDIAIGAIFGTLIGIILKALL